MTDFLSTTLTKDSILLKHIKNNSNKNCMWILDLEQEFIDATLYKYECNSEECTEWNFLFLRLFSHAIPAEMFSQMFKKQAVKFKDVN